MPAARRRGSREGCDANVRRGDDQGQRDVDRGLMHDVLDLAAWSEHGPDDHDDEQRTAGDVEGIGRSRPRQAADHQQGRENSGAQQQHRESGPPLRIGAPQAMPEGQRHQEEGQLQHDDVDAIQEPGPRTGEDADRVGEAAETRREVRVRPDRGSAHKAERGDQGELRADDSGHDRTPGRRRESTVRQEQDGQQRTGHEERRGPVDVPDRPRSPDRPARGLSQEPFGQPDPDKEPGDCDQQPPRRPSAAGRRRSARRARSRSG